jgi:hypothetical protein
MSAIQPKSWRWNYDAIIDEMLAFPELTQNEIAARLGYSAPWLSTIVNCDMFRERLAIRRNALTRSIDGAIQARLSDVAVAALDKVLERVNGEGSARIQTTTLMDIADKSLNRLGYGVKPASPQVVVNNQVVGVSATPEALREARARIRSDEARMIEAAPASHEVLSRDDSLLLGTEVGAPDSEASPHLEQVDVLADLMPPEDR